MQSPEAGRRGRRSGQALIEYVLLMAALATASIAFLAFMGKGLFGYGFRQEGLPDRVTVCASQPQAIGQATDLCRAPR